MDIQHEVNALHEQLAELYRGNSVDTVLKKQLWDRIELLEGLQIAEAVFGE